MDKLLIGKDFSINLNKLNRHGFITGSTGSGKTVTLKVLAENLAKAGVPVFLSDIKGDLASLAEKAELNEEISQRIEYIGLEEYEPRSFDVELYDVFTENGLPLRATISDMGPILLSKLMGLNDIQEGVLNIAFKIADDEGLLLIDTKDLRAILNLLDERKSELTKDYGNISSASIGAILRSLLVIEQQGGDKFFGQPEYDIMDLFRVNSNNEGIINILFAKKLIQFPKLYTTFMLWLLSTLYDTLPEVGDLDKPKMVFFFDEAHLIFETKDKILIDKLEQIVRLIRSKGVGIFFVTQKTTDLTDTILSQLGNRIQHSLRAFSPKEQKEVKSIAESFRQTGDIDLAEEILNLKTGEAIFSVLDENSEPTFAKKALICPPESKLGVVDQVEIMRLINASPLYGKYAEYIDNESAFEVLEQRRREQVLEEEKERAKVEEIKQTKKVEEKVQRKSNRMSPTERFFSNVVSSIGRRVGTEISRGIFGNKRR